MPFKSKSQVRRFGAMVKRGEVSKKKFQQWLDETPNIKSLPERIKKKKKKTTKQTKRKRRKSKNR